MRSLLAVTAALLGLLAASGCDATDLSATHRTPPGIPTVAPATRPSSTPSTASSSAAPSRSASASAPAAPSRSGTPKPTAVATNTSGGEVTGVPTSYADASARLDALGKAPHSSMRRFTTTGDTVYCVLHDPYVPTSCELGHGAIHDPTVCGQSMADAVGRIQLGDDGASPQCNSDTIREPGAKVIGAPAVVTDGSVQCGIEKIGVTCVNTRTHAGFFLTPGRYATFS